MIQGPDLSCLGIIRWARRARMTDPKVNELLNLGGVQVGGLLPRLQWLQSIGLDGIDMGPILSRWPLIFYLHIQKLNVRTLYISKL